MRKPTASNYLRCFCWWISLTSGLSLTLSTCTTVRGVPRQDLQDFLATPTNWPKIVLSSQSVESLSNRVDKPLVPGEEVKEVFGLPPLLPLNVCWKCNRNDEDLLEFLSPEGLPNIARNCRMSFNFQEDASQDVSVVLTMEFDPLSPLALASIPLLSVDNAIAMRLLLPFRSTTDLST